MKDNIIFWFFEVIGSLFYVMVIATVMVFLFLHRPKTSLEREILPLDTERRNKIDNFLGSDWWRNT